MGGGALHCIQHTCIIYIYIYMHLGIWAISHYGFFSKTITGYHSVSNPWVYIIYYNILTTFQILMYDHGQPSCSSFWRPHVVHCAEVHLGDMASCKLDRVLKSMHCLGAPKVHLVGPFLDEHGCHID